MNKTIETENQNKPSWLKYFFFMGESERNLVKQWLAETKPKTKKQKQFLKIVKRALKTIIYSYWISTIEPGANYQANPNLQLQFSEHEEPAEFSCDYWEELAKKFAPNWNSALANWYELILFYAYRIAKNYWTIWFVCEDSRDYARTSWTDFSSDYVASRKIGGFYDGVNNTYKITKYKSRFVVSGRRFDMDTAEPNIVSFYYEDDPKAFKFYATGVIVLRKNPYESSDDLIPQTKEAETNDLIAKAEKLITELKEVVDSNDFGENNKTIASIIDKLEAVEKKLGLSICQRRNYVYLFEIYLPEFCTLLKYYSELRPPLNPKDKELLTDAAKKFQTFVYSAKFNTSDVENSNLKFITTAKALIKSLNKED